MEEIKNFEDNAIKFTGDDVDVPYGSHKAVEPDADASGTMAGDSEPVDGLLEIVDTMYKEGDVLWWLESNYAHRGKVDEIHVETIGDDNIIEYWMDEGEGDAVLALVDEGDLYVSAEALAREVFMAFEPEDIEIEITK